MAMRSMGPGPCDFSTGGALPDRSGSRRRPAYQPAAAIPADRRAPHAPPRPLMHFLFPSPSVETVFPVSDLHCPFQAIPSWARSHSRLPPPPPPWSGRGRRQLLVCRISSSTGQICRVSGGFPHPRVEFIAGSRPGWFRRRLPAPPPWPGVPST